MSLLSLIPRDLYPSITRYLELHCNLSDTFFSVFRFLNNPKETNKIIFPYFPNQDRNIELHIKGGFGTGKCDTSYCFNSAICAYRISPQLMQLCYNCDNRLISSNKIALKSAECIELTPCDICINRVNCLKEDECIFCFAKNKNHHVELVHAWIPSKTIHLVNSQKNVWMCEECYVNRNKYSCLTERITIIKN